MPQHPDTSSTGQPPPDASPLFNAKYRRVKRVAASLIDLTARSSSSLNRLSLWQRFERFERQLPLQVLQVLASLAFVGLYIWSTYEPVSRGSWRHAADLALSAAFAVDYAIRLRASGPRLVLSPTSLLDLLSFAPGLMEMAGGAVALLGGQPASWLASLAGAMGLAPASLPDLRWFRIFRALRLLRLCLLTGNLPLMKLSRSALLSGAVNVRLLQLVASVGALLFTAASLVHAAERLPWHDALYFVTTTLTTVGYGDIVMKSTIGRLIVVVMMAVGVVLIPVRTSQLWGQMAARRLLVGSLSPGRPVVLLSGRLSEVRGFADLTQQFFHQLKHQHHVPRDAHLVVLANKPGYEFTAFQELHDHHLTLVEGSVLSAADLERCKAASSAAVLVLGDRFTHDAEAEDLDVLFRVWAIKSYTKCVPLTVQVLRASSLAKVSPFLDPHQDVVMSVELMRHRLLALSALCPGASTLLGNLLHTASTDRPLQASMFRPTGAPPPQVAGRTWFAEYVRGCGHDLYLQALPRAMEGATFGEAVRCAFHQEHLLLLGVIPSGHSHAVINPPHSAALQPHDQLVLLAHSERHAALIREVLPGRAGGATHSGCSVLSSGEDLAIAAAWAGGPWGAQHAGAGTAGRSGSGGGSGSSGQGSSTQRRQQHADGAHRGGSSNGNGQQHAAEAAAGGHDSGSSSAASAGGVNGNGSSAGGSSNGYYSGGKGVGPLARLRVRRYYPSLASYDEDDEEDEVLEVEGSFFSRQKQQEMEVQRQRQQQRAQQAQAAPVPAAATAAGPAPARASSAASVGSGTGHSAAGGGGGSGGQMSGRGAAWGAASTPTEAELGGVLPIPSSGAGHLGSHSHSQGQGRSGGGSGSGSSSGGGSSAAAVGGAPLPASHGAPGTSGRPFPLADAPWRQSAQTPGSRQGHVVLCGAADSFVEFARVLHSSAGMRDPDTGVSLLEVVVLHPNPPEGVVLALGALGPTHVVRGNPADTAALAQAGYKQARCLVYLGPSQRPAGSMPPVSNDAHGGGGGSGWDYGSTSRAAVLADAEALLTCYGVGEDDGTANLMMDEQLMRAAASASFDSTGSSTSASGGGWAANGGSSGGSSGSSGSVRGYSVVELSFTSSVRFLQPGLLLNGMSVWDSSCSVGHLAPRKSWRQRQEAEEAAGQQGLVQWQTNVYYCAGRVVVPALMDTFTIQAFAKRNLLLDFMDELCGDDGRSGGALLRQLPVPHFLAGRPYRELFDWVVATHGAVPLGLYRGKAENPAWRLHYVSTHPAWEDVVGGEDRVFVLRAREEEGARAGVGMGGGSAR